MSNGEQQAENPERLLSSYLLSENPGSIVLIGAELTDLHWPDTVRTPPVLKFATLAQFDDAEVVAPTVAVVQLEGLTDSLDHILGRAVRLFPERLIVSLDGQDPPDQTFFAFGFRRLNFVGSAGANGNTRWYEYQLSTYKSAPDWLNARFWANPERFELNDELDIYTDDEDEEE